MSVVDSQILEAVTFEPETASAIWRRYADVHPRKSLTKRLRNERREFARVLEQCAFAGLLERAEGDILGYPVPYYSRRKLQP